MFVNVCVKLNLAEFRGWWGCLCQGVCANWKSIGQTEQHWKRTGCYCWFGEKDRASLWLVHTFSLSSSLQWHQYIRGVLPQETCELH